MDSNGSHTWLATEAGQHLQEKLYNQDIVHGLTRLLDRVETLEKSVDRLATLMEQGPGMVSMATDMVDEAVGKAAERGVNLEERLTNAIKLAEKLTAPEMVDKIDQLVQTADRIPGMVSMATDMVDEAFRSSAENGIDVEGRLKAGLALVERLTEPAMVEKLEGLMNMADQLPGLMAMGIDSLDAGYQRAVESGLDIETLATQGIGVLKQLAKLLESGEVHALFDSGALDPKALRVISMMGDALVKGQTAPPKKIGLFGLMRSVGDPNVKRALGFLVSFGQHFGEAIPSPNGQRN